MTRRRGFGEVERRVSKSGEVSYRARCTMRDGTRYSRTLATKIDAEAWLAAGRSLIDHDDWTPPRARQEAEDKRQRDAAFNTFEASADRYLTERGLRPNTVRGYRRLLATRLLPYFGEMPLSYVTLTEVKAWRASLDASTETTNAAAYRLLRSILQAAAEGELIHRAPPKVRGADSARVKRVAKPATFDELQTIIEHRPDRLRLLITLAAYVELREGELLELRCSDVDGVTGRISVTRKVDKDVIPGASGACPNCGRATSETAGRPDLTIHLLRHTALTLAGQHGANAAELQARGGHASQAAMAIYQHATLDRDKLLADAIGKTYAQWASDRKE